ncbi:hypothetical protein ACFYY8_23760 [Streptosporangium sp. NPDC001559]|uniref:hypothetical protein n=1 Tax=Streptosporangium sp. NPDC001559 TaxID=3366187 RepID=UPI0036E6E2D3
MSKLSASALALFAAAGLSLAVVPAAQAQSAAQPAGVSAQVLGNAPSCVTVWQKTGRITKTGYARNDCRGRTLNLKIVWAHGADGSCHTVRPGGTISSKVARGGRTFDGANIC